MAIADFPQNLQDIIQQNMLKREFIDGLQSKIAYRSICDRESFPVASGETITKTRTGMLTPVTNPIDPTTNTNLDNGLTPSNWFVEQYTMALNTYGDTQDLNIVTQSVGIKKRFLENARKAGVQARQSLDRIARNALFNAYMGGNTRVTVTLGAPAASIKVDDIRGFQTVVAPPSTTNANAGRVVPVSASDPLPVNVGANTYSLISVATDAINVSTAFGGISGTLTFLTNVTVSDGTAPKPVVSVYAPTILRPNLKATSFNLASTDILTMSLVEDGVVILRDDNVPEVDGKYNMYLDNLSARQIFADPEFQLLFRGQYGSREFQNLDVIELIDVRFIRTTEAPQQRNFTNSASNLISVHRPILCGQGALVEGNFEGLTDSLQNMGDNESAEIVTEDGIAMITRPPIDRWRQIIAQSWYAINGYAVPTDVTATTDIIPTASQRYVKRAVVFELGSA